MRPPSPRWDAGSCSCRWATCAGSRWPSCPPAPPPSQVGTVRRMRHDGRRPDELLGLDLIPDFMDTADGSVLFSIGRTRVLCTASVEDSVPRWMAGRGNGWVTAEYGMLPASTGQRKQRDATRGKQDGRTVEIQRLIGRALRGVTDMSLLGERTVWVDCDVIQADGGTRCAAICGGYVAMHRALAPLVDRGALKELPLS